MNKFTQFWHSRLSEILHKERFSPRQVVWGDRSCRDDMAI